MFFEKIFLVTRTLQRGHACAVRLVNACGRISKHSGSFLRALHYPVTCFKIMFFEKIFLVTRTLQRGHACAVRLVNACGRISKPVRRQDYTSQTVVPKWFASAGASKFRMMILHKRSCMVLITRCVSSHDIRQARACHQHHRSCKHGNT